MAVSRPVLLALVGAVLAAAAWFATSGSRSSDSSSPAAVPAPHKAAPKASTKAEPVRPAQPKKAAASPAPAELARAERAAAAERGVPSKVTRTIDSGRTAVLFFFQPGAADDAATAKAVRGVRGQRRVRVFAIPIANVADYRAVVSGAGVSQAPAIVIATKKGATLVEGYIDGASLAQQVADAR